MFSSIEEAILEIQQGRMLIVLDDENRENEGDFIMPAQNITPADVNFMATHGRGLICALISADIAYKLNLPLMVNNLEDSMQTAFTLSVDAKEGISTGISAYDRALTLKLLASDHTKPEDLVRPGHIFPLIAKAGGVLSRAGHTEAAVDLARMAGFSSAGVICEILDKDGTAARVPYLEKLAKKHKLKMITIESLIEFQMKHSLNPRGIYANFNREFNLN